MSDARGEDRGTRQPPREDYYGWDDAPPLPRRGGAGPQGLRGWAGRREGSRPESKPEADDDDDDNEALWDPDMAKPRGNLKRLDPVAGYGTAAGATPGAGQGKSLRERFFPGKHQPSQDATAAADAGEATATTDGEGAQAPTMTHFAGIECDEALVRGLQASGIVAPSPIQAAAVPVLMSGANTIIHSPTGSGKTITFLLPLLARFKAQAQAAAAAGGEPVARQALVVVPSRELALQVWPAFWGFCSGCFVFPPGPACFMLLSCLVFVLF